MLVYMVMGNTEYVWINGSCKTVFELQTPPCSTCMASSAGDANNALGVGPKVRTCLGSGVTFSPGLDDDAVLAELGLSPGPFKLRLSPTLEGVNATALKADSRSRRCRPASKAAAATFQRSRWQRQNHWGRWSCKMRDNYKYHIYIYDLDIIRFKIKKWLYIYISWLRCPWSWWWTIQK